MPTATPASRSGFRLAVIVLALAVVPPLIVFLHRWYSSNWLSDLFRETWCKSDLLCALVWRPYFVLIWLCTIAVIVLVKVGGTDRIENLAASENALDSAHPTENQRRLGVMLLVSALLGVVVTIVRLIIAPALPGWDYILICLLYVSGWFLLTTPRGVPFHYLQAHWRVWVAGGLGLVALSWLLFSYYGRSNVSVFSVALMVVALLALFWQRRNLSPSYWLVLLALVVFTLFLNAWNFAIIGDEYAFYDTAAQLALRANIVEMGNAFFDGVKVYGAQPYFSSLLQAPTLRLFDSLGFGWRYGSILPSALSIFLFYYFLRAFLPRWVAFAAAFLIAVSHFLMVFSRIGYNNTQALLAMGLALAAATWAFQSKLRFAFVTFGVALAFCFYVFPAALYVTPVAVWLLLLYYPPRGRAALKNWGIALGTWLVLVIPLLFQTEYWATKVLRGSVVLRSNEIPNVLALAQRILIEFGYSFYSFLFVPAESHFVRVAYVDVMTAALVLVGLGVLIWRGRADKFALFVLTGWIMLLFFIGATHGTDLPPNTRMFLLVPWFCFIAAIGLQWLAARLPLSISSPQRARLVLAAVLAVILALNLYQAYDTSVRPANGYLEFDALLVRLAQNINVGANGALRSLVFVHDPTRQHVPSLQKELDVEYQPVQLVGIDATKRQAGALTSYLVPDRNLIVVSLRPDEAVRKPFQDYMRTTGWQDCGILSQNGEKRIEVWYAAPTPDPCATTTPPPPVRMPEEWVMLLLALVVGGGLVGLVRYERSEPLTSGAVPVGKGARGILPLGGGVRLKRENLTDPESNGYALDLNIRLTFRKPYIKPANSETETPESLPTEESERKVDVPPAENAANASSMPADENSRLD